MLNLHVRDLPWELPTTRKETTTSVTPQLSTGIDIVYFGLPFMVLKELILIKVQDILYKVQNLSIIRWKDT